ncbi:MAG TPA: hypothetical protein PLN21_17090 [Gemmatales bacterium]|nr:hypothetical protein [Gemmatales bacterium]
MSDVHPIPWLPIVTLAGSVFSTACTGYFWFVKVRKEQPNLKSFLHEHDLFLGNGRGDTRGIGLNVNLIVANYSSLPNAIVGTKLAVKLQGGTWQPLTGVTCDKSAPLPLNISPLQTSLLRLSGRLTFATFDELENQRDIVGAYSKHYLAQPLEFQVELQSLNNRVESSQLRSVVKDKETTVGLRIAA